MELSREIWIILNILFLLLFSSCKEDEQECQGVLKTRPLKQLQNCIEGNWKFLYSIGGFTGQMRIEYEHSFIEFRNDATIFWIHEGQLVSEGLVEWSYIEDQLNETTHVLKYSRMGVPGSWGFQEIRKDTLFIYDVGNDGFVHVLKRE